MDLNFIQQALMTSFREKMLYSFLIHIQNKGGNSVINRLDAHENGSSNFSRSV
jgi:hypothetical protein